VAVFDVGWVVPLAATNVVACGIRRNSRNRTGLWGANHRCGSVRYSSTLGPGKILFP
jgi:hypothetical protein